MPDNIKKVSWKDIQYWKPEELFSPDILSTPFRHLISWDLVLKLEKLRAELASSLRCNYGDFRYRGVVSAREHWEIRVPKFKSVKLSMHPMGMAADLDSPTLKPRDIAIAAGRVGFSFIQVYKTFCHVDVRPSFTGAPTVIFMD